MLQGTFETLSLPELLGLLASSRKTGALWLEAGPATAAVYVDGGRCCAAQSGDLTGAVSDAPALLSRLVEICFAAARTEDGSFRFGGEAPPWTCDETVDLDVAIDELGRLLDEWREIQAIVPSLDCRLKLTDELGSDKLVVDRDRWRLLVAIDGRRTVRELVRKLSLPVLDVCHAVVALVEAGAASVVAAPNAPAARTNANAGAGNGGRRSAEADKRVEPEAPYGPGVESPHPGPVAEGEKSEKGEYLRVFSALNK